MRRVPHTRSRRAGSLLILVSVLLLALTGVIYLAQPAAAQVPPLTIVKQATPADDTEFHFTSGCVGGSDPPFAFTLTDPSHRTVALPYYCRQYQVVEEVPPGWSLDGVSCNGGKWSLEGGVLYVSQGDSQEPITCTFHNSSGRIIVRKAVVPADAPAAVFRFHPSFGFDFLIGGGNWVRSGPLRPGVYSVAEVGLPAGWSLASASCSDGSSPAAIGLSPGEVVTCTFVNQYEEEGGSLTILKRTTPAGGTGFAFDGTLGPFTLDDGGSRVFDDLAAGEYTVTETPPTGWEFEAVTCYTVPGAAVDYEVVGSGVVVNLAEGQDVTCKFANREEEEHGPGGSLTIVKRTLPAGGTGFAFDAGALGAFTLDDGGSRVFDDLAAGAYAVAETPPANWKFASVECDALDWEADGASVTVNLAEGEAAVCTFHNGELPYTGSTLWLPMLLAGLVALLAGLGAWTWSWMKEAQKA